MKTRNTAIALAIACIASSAAAQNQPIRIGVVTPLSGTYAGIGQQVIGPRRRVQIQRLALQRPHQFQQAWMDERLGLHVLRIKLC